MKKSKVLAVLLTVLMVVTLLPSMVFAAAAPAGALDGKLKVKGVLAVGSTLSADYSKVKPEGITDDNVDFSWSLKDGDLTTEVGTDKTYKIDEKDLGLPIVLKITAKENSGISGELTVTTQEVSATEEEAKALEEKKKEEAKAAGEASDEEETGEDGTGTDNGQTEADESAAAENTGEDADTEGSGESTGTEENAGTGVSADTEASADTEESQNTVNTDQENTVVVETGEDSSGAQNAESTDSTDETPNPADIPAGTEVNYSASASTADGSGVLNFGTVQEGYEEAPEAQEVTITNTGTGDLNFKANEPENFMVTDINNEPLKSGESVKVSVAPRKDLGVGEYKDLITYTTEEGAEAFFEADFTVKAADEEQDTKDKEEDPRGQISVSITPGTLDFGSAEQGYDSAPEAKTVTVENTGTEAIRLKQPVSETGEYTVGDIDAEVLNASEKASFSVQPKAGLPAGDHSEKIQITDKDGNLLGEISMAFQVTEPAEPEPEYKISVSPESLEFGTVQEGYGKAGTPEAQTVTVTNNGNTEITLVQPKDDTGAFVVGTLSDTDLPAGAQATFTVQPGENLSKGEYLNDIGISISGRPESDYVNAHFSVKEKKTEDTGSKNNLTGIKKPSDIKDLPNGTEKTQKALKLPGTVKITTTKGEQKASVKWDIKGCSYDPSSSDRQTFNVKGTVSLPDGVNNPDKISTVVAVSVTVNEYKGKDSAAADNKITGIDPNGKYDTNTKITFTAVGAGMDNNAPRKGDTRYQPKSWKITETRTWDGEPYTATFRVSKPGNYTLKVTFGQQKYDGSNWKDTGTQSESSVTFTVTQAETLTVTPSPAVTQANQKTAVQTGDNTPIMIFVIILIAAAGCAGGILVYRRKNK